MAPYLDIDDYRLTDSLKSRYGVDDGWGFAMERRARWNEVDGLGHVNNTSYLIYFEDARNTYLECAGLPPLSATTPSPVMALSSQRYISPLVFKDHFLVTARATRIGNTSFTMEYAAWRDGLVAQCEATLVLMINATGEKTRVPDDVRARAAELEGRDLSKSAPN